MWVQTSISGFTKRMFFNWTIESAISRVQYLRQDLIIPTGKPWSEMSKMWAALAREPGCEAPELVVVLDEQHAVARLREHVGAREATEAASYDDHVILVGDSLEPVICHGGAMVRDGRCPRQLVSGAQEAFPRP